MPFQFIGRDDMRREPRRFTLRWDDDVTNFTENSRASAVFRGFSAEMARNVGLRTDSGEIG